MTILNLINPQKGTVDYEIISFPDGQKHLKILSEIDRKDSDVRILCRICNAEDLFILAQALDVFNRHELKPVVAIFYLMGARMDRIMSFNEPFTLKIVIDVLNRYNAEFRVLEPHNKEVIEKNGWKSIVWNDKFKNCLVCYPDDGAFIRYYGHYFNDRGEAIICSKKRDSETGKLSGFEVKLPERGIEGRDVVVVDDLIDGGGTFCGIAPLLREKNPHQLSLHVCHAIQLDGIKRVAALYDHVKITNSYFDWASMELPENVEVEDIVSR